MAEALAPDFGKCDFDATLVADHAAMLHALVLAAQAFPVSDRPKDAGAEQTIALRFEGAVVDRLRLRDLAVRPAADLFWRGQADPDGIKILDCVTHVERAGTVQSDLRLLVEGGFRAAEFPVASSQFSSS